MFPLFSIILALALALSYPEVVKSPQAPDMLGAAAVVLFVGVFSRVLLSRAARRVRLSPDGDPDPILRISALFRPGIVVAFGVIVYQFHWPAIVGKLGLEHWILLDEFVVLFPFALMLVLVIDATGRVEERLDLHDFTRRSYLSFQLRQFLLPVAPVLFFLLLKDLVEYGAYRGVGWVVELMILLGVYPFLRWISLAGLLLILYCLMPFLLKWSFKAKSLPAGPLRARLEVFSRRERFKARDILLWPTGGNVLNAAVIGIAGPFRYVLMTDALVDELSEDEVEAVFAHEVGHARNHHMLLFFFFTLAYGLLTYLVLENLPPGVMGAFDNQGVAQLVFALVGFILWFFIVFGFVSRRFEQQADVYGAIATGRLHEESDAPPEEHPFVRALSGLRRQMGEVRESKGWRHFPITERIDYLIEFLKDDRVRKSYRRRMKTLLVFFIGTLAALWVAAAATVPSQLAKGAIRRAEYQAAVDQENARRQAATLHDRAVRTNAEGRRLEAAFLERESLAYYAQSNRDQLRLRAMELHRVLETGQTLPRGRIQRLTELSGLYQALFGPAPSRKVLSEALSLNQEIRSVVMFLAARDLVNGWRRLDLCRELAEETTLLLALLGDALEREGRLVGARLAFEDARAALPSGHPDRACLDERIDRIDAGS